MKIQSVVFAFVALVFAACNATSSQKKERMVYSFDHPDSIRVLPIDLHEISGIVALNESIAVAVQDEVGSVFVYDLKSGTITSKLVFGPPGDYEGVASNGNDLFVLRSDGVLFRIIDYVGQAHIDSLATNVPTKNNEGLCYDASENRLLIAAKSKAGKGKAFKDKRVIYSFSLDSLSDARELFAIDVSHVVQKAKLLGIDLPDIEKKNGSIVKDVLKFKMSELAIEPETSNIYVLSAADHFLFVFSPNGEVLEVHPLNPSLYNKPEGITFISNNRIIITNEGQSKQPTLLHLSLRNTE